MKFDLEFPLAKIRDRIALTIDTKPQPLNAWVEASNGKGVQLKHEYWLGYWRTTPENDLEFNRCFQWALIGKVFGMLEEARKKNITYDTLVIALPDSIPNDFSPKLILKRDTNKTFNFSYQTNPPLLQAIDDRMVYYFMRLGFA